MFSFTNVQTCVNICLQFKLIKLSPELSFIHRPSVLYFEVGVFRVLLTVTMTTSILFQLLTFGVLMCVVLLLPVLWKVISSP